MIKGNGYSGWARLWDDLQDRNAGLLRNQVLRNVAALGSGSGLAQAIMAVNAIIFARFLSPEGYGLLIGAYAAAGLTSFLFNWGLDTWLLRHAAMAEQPGVLLGNVLSLKAAFGLIWGAALLAWLPRLRPDLYLTPLLLVSILDVWAEGLFTTQTAVLTTQKRVPTASALLVVSRGGRLLNTLILILFGLRTPLVFAQGRLVGTLVALGIALYLLRPHFSSGELSQAGRLFRLSLPYGLSDLLATLYLQADVTLLGLLLGVGRTVGLYAPASGLVNALFVIPAAAYVVMIPVLTRQLESGSGQFSRNVRVMYIGFTLLGVAMWWGLVIAGRLLVAWLLGQAYQTSGFLLVVLSPILFLKALSFASAAVLVAVGWQSRRLGPQALSAVANILLNLYAIPRFGVWGVASVYVASETILTVGYLLQVVKWFRMRR